MDSRYGKGKDYLSYSALRLWNESKDRYRAKYYEERKDISTVYTQFGKKIAELLEARDFTNYPALEKVPYYSVSEEPVELLLDDVPVRGFIDLFEPKEVRFGEVKTGIVHKTNGNPWSMIKVRQHEQLPFYSLLLQEKYGSVDPVCHLIWLETYFKEVPSISKALRSKGELTLTGNMKIFKRRIAKWERQRIREDIISTAKDIQKDYENYLKGNIRLHAGAAKEVVGKAKKELA